MKGECKLCGCTDLDCSQCVDKTGVPCFWMDEDKDICSACVYRDHSMTVLMNLANAAGAEFEDEKMAVDILEHTFKKVIEAVLDSDIDIEKLRQTLK